MTRTIPAVDTSYSVVPPKSEADPGAAAASSASAPADPFAGVPVVVRQAKALWLAALRGADLTGIRVTIDDLPGLQLGWTVGRSTTIDATAAGWGWSVVGAGQMDLLTVGLHELGRVLGYTTEDAARVSVTQAWLAPGERVPLELRGLHRGAAGLRIATPPRPSIQPVRIAPALPRLPGLGPKKRAGTIRPLRTVLPAPAPLRLPFRF